MALWAYHNQVKIDSSRPGKPTDDRQQLGRGLSGHRGLADGIQCESSSRALRKRTPNEFAGNCRRLTLEL